MGGVVLNDRGDVQFFRSRDEAALEVEAVDVEDGTYEAFDWKGRVLQIAVDGDRVVFRESDPEAFAPGRLDRILRDFVTRARLTSVYDDLGEHPSLEALVSALATRLRT